MLPGLLHYAFVSGHNQKSQVNGTNASQHILDKPLVARNVNNADLPPAGQSHPGETQINGHLPLFFFGEAVRVNVSQGFNQRGFTVVNVAGGTDNVHSSRLFRGLLVNLVNSE